MKRLFAVLAVLVPLLALSSCKKDETSRPSIVGTWQLTKASILFDGEEMEFDATERLQAEISFVFNADGTGSEIEVDYADGNHASNFSYVYNGEEGVVVILYDDGYEETLEVLFVSSDVIYLDGDKLTRQ